MNKFIALLFFILLSDPTCASVPIKVHMHKVTIKGVLPEPYKTISLEVELDQENDNVTSLELIRGKERIVIPESILNQLKDIALNSLDISHEMHRYSEESAKSEHGSKGDWLHISMNFGIKYRVKITEKGKDHYHWGKDKAIITIIKDQTVSFRVHKFETEIKRLYGKQ